MTGVDDDTPIASQAQVLLGDSAVHLVAIPHISWKSLGGGLPLRTPAALAIAFLVAVVMYMPPISLHPWVALPAAAVLGLLVRLVLRERIPTTIGPPAAPPMKVGAVVDRVILSLGGVPCPGSTATRTRESSPRWARSVR